MHEQYKLIEERSLKALDGTGKLLVHKKTGARILTISNSDDNKVFNIAFRTPPKDDTGLPHILEHSVLCGSRKFPLKDPFVELAKGSLNTFLNAMTYSDKTMYPVASRNKKDFDNLMDVYLDAVFYPNIYQDPRILQQEGWHYELEDLNSDLIYNGVVFNEMKGASSSPEQILFRQIQKGLFPNHPYGCDSGGDPLAIPELSAEQFLDFHSTYYHPSNSFIYMYGDMDMEEKLTWLDEAYLSGFDAKEVASEIEMVAAFDQPQHIKVPYGLSETSELNKKTYLSYNVAMTRPEHLWEGLGLEILEYLLLEAPGAPLKEALLALDIAEDVFGSYDNGMKQPTFSIIAKNSDPEHEAIFLETIQRVLKEVATKGLDQRKVQAAINYFEFRTREADFGTYPKGVIYVIKAMDNWLYDENPLEVYEYDQAFDGLKEQVKQGGLERLIEKYFIQNNHQTVLQLVPDTSLLANMVQAQKDKLELYKNSLSTEEKEALIKSTEELRVFQTMASTPEDLASIPLLDKEDVDKLATRIDYKVVDQAGVNYVEHTGFTNNIVYGKLLFDMSDVALEDMPKVSLLAKCLTKVATKDFSYSALSDEVNIHTGGISCGTNVYGVNGSHDECQLRFEIKFKCFRHKIGETVNLVNNIIGKSLLTDHKRLGDLMNENRSRLAMSLMGSGHSAAMTRSMSYHYLPGLYRDLLDGIGFYRYLEQLEQEGNMAKVTEALEAVRQQVLTKNNLVVLVNAEEEAKDEAIESIATMVALLPEKAITDTEEEVCFSNRNEAFKSASKVQYNALTGDFIHAGYSYSGHMKVLQTILSLDYMWTEVRVKGGAYGGFAGFRRTGIFYLGSYRDPNFEKTYEIYRQLPSYIEAIDFDERELTKYIIGTISQMDTPMTPSMKGDKALNMYMSNITMADIQTERDEVLNVSIDLLRPYAKLVEAVIDQNYRCVIGNEQVLAENKAGFDEIKELFQG